MNEQPTKPLQLHIEQVELLRSETYTAAQNAHAIATRLVVINSQLDFLAREMRAARGEVANDGAQTQTAQA